MLADIILRLLGDNPQYISEQNKTAYALAGLIDLVVIPSLYILSFVLPLLFLWYRKRKWKKDFTILNILLALGVGVLLSFGIYKLNEWSYGWGLGIIYHEIYGR